MRRFFPYLAASFTGIQVGAALVASEAVVETTGAAGLGFWRYLIASIVLVPFWIASRKPRIRRGDLLPISIIGIGQFGLLIAMLNVAVLLASSARVSFIFAALPLATLAFERMIFHMGISKAETLAILLSLLGIGLSSGGGFWCWLYALSHIPAGHVTAFLGLSPVTATLLSVAFKDESLKASVIAALGLVVAALLFLVFAKGTKSTR